MIKRVRKKFILVAMIATTVVTLLLIFAINLFNAIQVNQELDRALQEISHVKTRAGEPEQQGETGGLKGHKDGKKDRRAASTKYEGRFFTMLLKDGQFYFQNGEEISEEIESFGEAVIETGKTAGTIDDYRFLATETGDATVISFLDCTTEIQGERNLLMISAAVGCAGILLSFFFILLMSGKIILPLKESMEKQKRFITDAGHELKTPLTIIDADISVAEMENGPSEWLDDVKAQTKRLAGLTNDLIYLSRMDEGQAGLQMIDFPLSDVVTDTVQSFRGRAQIEEKILTASIEPMVSCHGDEKSITKLLTILLDNAVKYACEKGDITVSLQKKSKYIELIVQNDTETIDPASIPHFFDRFYRADSSRNSSRGGYGIGLSIAQAVVAAHKGRISASAPSETSLRITVQLPC